MKRMRRGLLTILIAALVAPAPMVSASAPPEDGRETPPVTSAPIMPESSSPQSPTVLGDVSSSAATLHPAPPAAPPVSPAAETSRPAAPRPEVSPPPAQPSTPAAPEPSPNPSTPTPPPSTPSPAASGRLIISKLNPDEPEIIELYNPEDYAVDLTDARIEFVPRGKAPVALKRFESGSVPAGSFVALGDESRMSFDVSIKNVISLSGTLRVVLSDYEEELAFGEGTALDTAGARSGQRFLQRCQADRATFVMTAFDATQLGGWPNCQQDPPPTAPPRNACSGVRLSEIGAYTAEQFIELQNTSDQPVNLADCQVTTQRSRTPYVLPEYELEPQEFFRISALEAKLSLTKTSGTVYFLTSAGEEIDEVRYEKLAKGTSWTLVDGEWRQTHAPTPGEVNHFQRWQTCEPGKHINEDTGNCVKIPSPPASPADCAPGYYRHPETGRCRKTTVAKAPAPCKEGQYRSEETGRCRSIASAAAKMLKPCKDGYFRSPETGRCRKIAADRDVLKQCAEGYERNPTTKRCRKIRTTAMPTAGFAPQAAQQVAGATWGWWVFGGVSLLAVGYGIWQWRWELGQMLRRVGGVFTAGKK